MVAPGQCLPRQAQTGMLVPSVHGFRMCRSSPSCTHFSQPRPIRSSRSGLQVVNMSSVAAPAPLEYLSFSGDAQGTRELSLLTADAGKATGLVHRYVTLARQNGRRGTASTLTRSEVRGGGKKPFAQKGTGNARQGSIRTPLKPGGGVIFGPKPRDWSISMNKKERRLAYATAFQSAAESISVIEDLEGQLKQPKTKELLAALGRWGVSSRDHALIIVDHMFENLQLSSRNIANVRTNSIANLSVYDLLRADRIFVESSALAYIQEFYGKASKDAAPAAAAEPAQAAESSQGAESAFEGDEELSADTSSE